MRNGFNRPDPPYGEPLHDHSRQLVDVVGGRRKPGNRSHLAMVCRLMRRYARWHRRHYRGVTGHGHSLLCARGRNLQHDRLRERDGEGLHADKLRRTRQELQLDFRWMRRHLGLRKLHFAKDMSSHERLRLRLERTTLTQKFALHPCDSAFSPALQL